MRKANYTMKDIVEKITLLKGKRVEWQVNRGRKKIEKYEGVIETVYPSVFTLNAENSETLSKQSYSFNDVLCGDVTIREMDEA